jgi:hypothetical protein
VGRGEKERKRERERERGEEEEVQEKRREKIGRRKYAKNICAAECGGGGLR